MHNHGVLTPWGTFWSLKNFLRVVRVLLVLRGRGNMGEIAKIGWEGDSTL